MADQNIREPIFNMPPIVQTLCLLNIGLFLLRYFFPQTLTDETLWTLSFVAARYTEGDLLSPGAMISPVTHMFIHASWLHLAVNVTTLMAFGAGIERAWGGRRMLLLYFATGLCGAGIHVLFAPHSPVPMVGASGAISGLFGGILMMMNDAGGAGGFRKLLPVIVVWIGISVFFGIYGVPGEPNPVAWDVHIAGFISGMLLYKPVTRLRI